jgi:hypothetical protein
VTKPYRFPPPWTVEVQAVCFVVGTGLKVGAVRAQQHSRVGPKFRIRKAPGRRRIWLACWTDPPFNQGGATLRSMIYRCLKRAAPTYVILKP